MDDFVKMLEDRLSNIDSDRSLSRSKMTSGWVKTFLKFAAVTVRWKKLWKKAARLCCFWSRTRGKNLQKLLRNFFFESEVKDVWANELVVKIEQV